MSPKRLPTINQTWSVVAVLTSPVGPLLIGSTDSTLRSKRVFFCQPRVRPFFATMARNRRRCRKACTKPVRRVWWIGPGGPSETLCSCSVGRAERFLLLRPAPTAMLLPSRRGFDSFLRFLRLLGLFCRCGALLLENSAAFVSSQPAAGSRSALSHKSMVPSPKPHCNNDWTHREGASHEEPATTSEVGVLVRSKAAPEEAASVDSLTTVAAKCSWN
mmetsp:Transcript_53187/g.171536  ORF Transcript_53187/g.171536 Transcript_53187/m.171536 type:complete len:217 (+) Transcript_53187:534-1184(+)